MESTGAQGADCGWKRTGERNKWTNKDTKGTSTHRRNGSPIPYCGLGTSRDHNNEGSRPSVRIILLNSENLTSIDEESRVTRWWWPLLGRLFILYYIYLFTYITPVWFSTVTRYKYLSCPLSVSSHGRISGSRCPRCHPKFPLPNSFWHQFTRPTYPSSSVNVLDR